MGKRLSDTFPIESGLKRGSTVRVGKRLSDTFPIERGLNKEVQSG